MNFDLIVPTYKPDEKFQMLIERVSEQSCQPGKILIVNTEEKYWRELSVMPGNMEIIHIRQKEFNHGQTRRMAAEKSDADFFVCMTQDAIPADDRLFERLLAAFQDETVGAAYARQLADREVGIIEQYTRTFNYPAESRIKRKADEANLGIKTWFCSNVCAAYRKSAYVQAGGFVVHTIFNEDMLMAEKLIELNYGVAYQAQAKVWHAHRYSCQQQFKRNFDLGVSHREFREVFGRVSSETEGICMIRQTIDYLKESGHAYLIPELIFQSAAKFLGYRIGKCYDHLPVGLVRILSATPGYF